MTTATETYECPKCGTTQPVSAGTAFLIEEGVVTVCCGPEVIAPAPGPVMPEKQRLAIA